MIAGSELAIAVCVELFETPGRCNVLREEIAAGEDKEQWYDGAMEYCFHGFGFGWA
jgi:hypothetical protein